MKVKPEDFTHMRVEIEKFVDLHKEDCIKHANSGLSEKRIYWDFANACGLNKFICDVLYKYCNNNHVEMALKYIYRNLWL